jgi:hypothetical protein
MTHPTVGLFLTLVLSLLVVPLAADAQQRLCQLVAYKHGPLAGKCTTASVGNP